MEPFRSRFGIQNLDSATKADNMRRAQAGKKMAAAEVSEISRSIFERDIAQGSAAMSRPFRHASCTKRLCCPSADEMCSDTEDDGAEFLERILRAANITIGYSERQRHKNSC